MTHYDVTNQGVKENNKHTYGLHSNHTPHLQYR